MRVQRPQSVPSCSFCAMPYLCVERARVRFGPKANARSQLGLILGNLQHDFIVHRRPDVALRAPARSREAGGEGAGHRRVVGHRERDSTRARAHRFFVRSSDRGSTWAKQTHVSKARRARAGQGRAGQGRAGQGRAGQGG